MHGAHSRPGPRDREGIDRFRLAIDASPGALVMVDGRGVIQVANRALEELFGYERDELLGRPVETLVPEALRREHAALRMRYMAAPEARSMGAPRALAGARKDGRPVPVEVRLNPVQSGDAWFVLASVFEISRRRRVERQLDRIFSLTRELICVVGPDGVLQRVNPAVAAALGFSEAELTGRPFLEFIHPDDRAAAAERSRRRRSEGDESPSEIRCLHRDGSCRVVLWNATWDPELDLVYAVGHDISERKAGEQELQRANQVAQAMNKELEAFSYSVSHDLRAPLRAIDGFALALSEDYAGRLDDTGRDYIDRVRRAAQRMSALIDDLLNLSRISRQELRTTRVALSEIVERRIEELRQQAPGRHVEVEIERDVVASGDPGLLTLALHNLLDNAWKYTSKREQARIEFGRAFVEDVPACFVRDDGVGFDMDHADRLFGAFQRLHRTEEFEGTGIGLATVQRIVNLHGGRLWAEAAVDEGATFFLTLGEDGVQ